MIQLNGREIFQKERAERKPSEEPATESSERTGNRRLNEGRLEAFAAGGMTGKEGTCGLRLVGSG
jgi:hypothetical protein